MAREGAIDAARFAYATYNAFQAAVVQELGLERALRLQAQAARSLGIAQGQMLKRLYGIEKADIQAVARMLLALLNTSGFETEIVHIGPRRVAYKATRCPVYEGGQMTNFDQDMLEASCRSGAVCFVDAAAQELNSRLRCRLRAFRTGADGGCVEEIVMI